MTKTVAALLSTLALSLALSFAEPANGATLEIGETALQKLLDSKFKDGKIPIGQQDDCNNPYIETVHVTINQGRIQVTGHLSGHIGGRIAGICIAPADPSNFTISGVPVASGSILKLTNIQLDYIEKRELERIIGFILTNFAGDAVQMDMKPAAENALKGSAPYQITLDNLVFQSITGKDGTLAVNFDFKLSVQ